MATPAHLLNARNRRLALLDPSLGLHQTHSFPAGTTPIDVGASFPVRDRPVTLALRLAATAAGATGVVLELGSSTSGVKVDVDAGSVFVAAGDGSGGGGVGGSFDASGLLGAVGRVIPVVLAISPGDGRIKLFVDGAAVLRLDGGQAMGGGAWAADSDGSYGAATVGTANTRASAVSAAPTNFELVSPLSVFVGQLPLQFAGA